MIVEQAEADQVRGLESSKERKIQKDAECDREANGTDASIMEELQAKEGSLRVLHTIFWRLWLCSEIRKEIGVRIVAAFIGTKEPGHATVPSCLVFAEIGRVAWLPEVRHDGRRDSALLQSLPIDAIEPRVVLDVVGSSTKVAKAPTSIGRQQTRDEVARDRVNLFGKDELASEDFLIDEDRIGIVKGWIAGEHFVQQDAERPPVDSAAVTTALNDLRSEVLGRTAEGPGAVFHLLGKAKVGDLGVAVRVNEQVLRLEISVHHLILMQVLDGENDGRDIEPSHVG